MTYKTIFRGRFTWRKFLRGVVGLIVMVVLCSCGSSDPTPTATVSATATTVASEELKEIKMVSVVPLDAPDGRLASLILEEAFGRNGIEYSVQVYPHQRCIDMVNSGEADGDLMRVHSFTDGGANPNHVRVEEYIIAGPFFGLAVKPGIQLDGLESLQEGGYTVGCLTGVQWCEVKLAGLLDEDKLHFATRDTEGALMMLVGGRFDVLVAVPATLDILEKSGEFKDAGIYNAGQLDEIRVYTYLHKKHEDLVPVIAATIAEMRAEGLIDEYIQQVQAETVGE